jgi:hypothetical protein
MFITSFIFREQDKSSFNQMLDIIQVTMQQDALLIFWGFCHFQEHEKVLFNYNSNLLIFFLPVLISRAFFVV